MDSMKDLFVVPEGIQTRWASPENPSAARGGGGQSNGGRKGCPSLPLKGGETITLAEAKGVSGTVRRIWITINERSSTMLRGLRIEFYWDGCRKPAVSAPLGDFFGHGLGRMAVFEGALFSSPQGRSFNCFVPMPFRKGMRIEVTNETNQRIDQIYWDVDFTVGDKHPAEAAYFHACWRRENLTVMYRDFEILPKVAGWGRYLGCNIGVIANQKYYFRTWWGEGEVKMYIDGDAEFPTLCGTGTEDYIGTGWCQGRFTHLYQGCPVGDAENMQYTLYRYHVPDPVYFARDVRVTMQQIGGWDPDHKALLHYAGKPIYHHGPGKKVADLSREGGSGPYGLIEREDDWSACAYFYLDKPENDLPPLASLEKRTEGLLPSPPIAQ